MFIKFCGVQQLRSCVHLHTYLQFLYRYISTRLDVQWSGWVWVGEYFFWYRPTRVVPYQRPLNGCVCVCVCTRARKSLCVYNLRWKMVVRTFLNSTVVWWMFAFMECGDCWLVGGDDNWRQCFDCMSRCQWTVYHSTKPSHSRLHRT